MNWLASGEYPDMSEEGKRARELDYQRNYNKQRKGDRRSKAAKESKMARAEFVVWDGEGAEINGVHEYVLFAWHNTRTGESGVLTNPVGLTTVDILDFMTATAKEFPRGIHCCFGANYDVNMLLRDAVDLPTMRLLQSDGTGRRQGPVEILPGYAVRYRQRKCLDVYYNRKWNKAKAKMVSEVSYTLWDVIGFFQMAFINVVEKWLGKDYPELPTIREGKARRSDFSPNELPYMEKYCLAELRALGRIMELLAEYVQEAGLVLNRWDGAGALAAALLKREGVKAHIGELPAGPEYATRGAYFGGRIETLRYGHQQSTIHHYDVNSAYPSMMAEMPSLNGGEWKHHGKRKRPLKNDFTVYYVRWDLHSDYEFYPFPHRDFGGAVKFPPAGWGWVWAKEVKAGMSALLSGMCTGTIELVEAWEYQRPLGEPFRFVPETYLLRQRWVKEGKGAEKVLKLGLNSLYGKTAQQLGGSAERKPPFFALAWAGYITSGTRAKLFEAAMSAPESIISFATDGLFSLAPLAIPIDKEKVLGGWDYQIHTAMTIVQAGVYWLHDGERVTGYSRGFSKAGNMALTEAGVLAAWQIGETTLTVSSRREFITMGRIAAGQIPYDKWCTWRDGTRALTLIPQDFDGRPKRWTPQYGEPWHRLERSKASRAGCLESHVKTLLWESEENANDEPTEQRTERFLPRASGYYDDYED